MPRAAGSGSSAPGDDASRLPVAPAAPPGPGSILAAVSSFHAAYLIHGDDHGRIAERRAKLRAVAEAGSGPGDVEA